MAAKRKPGRATRCAGSVGHGGWGLAGRIGGGFLIASVAFAYYGGLALTVNTAWQRILLPVGGKV